MFGLPVTTLLKLGAVVAGALLIGAFVLYFRHIKSEADKVPALQATIAQQNLRAQALADKMMQVEAAKQQADKDFSAWKESADATIESITKAGRKTAASVNPVCAPSVDDRKLRNDALKSILGSGQGGSATSVPAATSPAH